MLQQTPPPTDWLAPLRAPKTLNIWRWGFGHQKVQRKIFSVFGALNLARVGEVQRLERGKSAQQLGPEVASKENICGDSF